MIILVDTNLLCRLCNSKRPVSPETAAARRALQVLRSQGHQLAITPQNIYEFWATATRPTGTPPAGANGLGMPLERVDLWLTYFLRAFTLLPDSDRTPLEWRSLVQTYRIVGFKAHDARLAAAMIVHNVTHLLTFNAQDFRRFPHLTILDPASIT